MTDQTTHQQESDVLISTRCDKAEDGSYTATVSVSGLASEEQAKGDVRRMREALSAHPEMQQALPQLPQAKWIEIDTPGADFDTTLVATMAEAKDMLDLEEKDEHTWQQKLVALLFTADQMRAYAAEAVRAALGSYQAAPDGWMPIETAPKDGRSLLLWESGSSVPFVGAWREGRRPGWCCDTEHYNTDGDACVISSLWQGGVTHWMPLPAAPSPGAEGTIKQDLRVGGPT